MEKTASQPPERIVQVGTAYQFKDYSVQLNQLLDLYGDVISCTSIGSSVLGKPLWCLKIGRGPRKVHVNAAVHANEWITAPLLLRFIEAFAAGCKQRGAQENESSLECRRWFDNTTLIAVPMVNPDGVDLSQGGIDPACSWAEELLKWNGNHSDFSKWKANARGIDLNDQFPAYWEEEQSRRGITEPAPQDYGGTAPLTEPEAIALAELTSREQFDYVLSLHTQGREIYWNYREYEPEIAEQLALRLAKVSGYRAVKLGGSDAGYKDWFIYRFGRPGFTIEVGEGVNPLPVSDFDEMYGQIYAIIASIMDS
ncbi:peptidase M14 [Paenibacillus sp. CAA11]|nr:peptidase M14 [Paenibacillus sp. CAA11]